MRILVTGGTGYIGSHTVVELILAEHDVVIVDNFANSKPSVAGRIGEITGLRPLVIEVDVRDEKALDAVVAGGDFDAVIHFAALKSVAESVAKPLDYYETNIGGSTTLFRVLDRHGVRTVVFSSSATVYGESDDLPFTESSPTQPPINPYGWTKLIMEQILSDLHRSDDRWNVGILRYFNPVGAHESGLIGEDPNDLPNNLMPYITQVAAEKLPELRIFGGDYPTPDGTAIRDYIHVVDLAKGHLEALSRLSADPGFHVWNLGTGRGTSVLEMVNAFERATGVEVPHRIVERRPGDVIASYADVSKAAVELGWEATLDVERMCSDAWRWQIQSGRFSE